MGAIWQVSCVTLNIYLTFYFLIAADSSKRFLAEVKNSNGRVLYRVTTSPVSDVDSAVSV